MKTVNETKGYLNYRTWIRAGFMMIAVVGLMACGSKKSKNNNPVYVGPSCQGCSQNQVSYMGMVARQQSSSMGQPIAVELDLFADQNALAQAQQWGMPYQGYVSATGTLYVPYSLPQCGVQAGNYPISSIQQGYMGADGAGRSVELMMQASNGMQVILDGFTQNSSMVGPSGRSFPYRYVAKLYLNGCEVFLY